MRVRRKYPKKNGVSIAKQIRGLKEVITAAQGDLPIISDGAEEWEALIAAIAMMELRAIALGTLVGILTLSRMAEETSAANEVHTPPLVKEEPTSSDQ